MAAADASIKVQRKRGPKPKGSAAQSRALREIAAELNNMAQLLDTRTIDDLTLNPADMQKNFSDLFSSSKIFRAYNYIILEYDTRMTRPNHLPPELFGEPGWDMMLFLYIQQVRGELVLVTRLCRASGVPPTTALRYIDTLESHGLIEKSKSEADSRRVYVQLAAGAFETLTEMFDRS